ncbi:MAG: 3-hydroxyacyl-CoA dehydrogenase [Bacteroidetes bacterium]|nr:3-hydroxyacyl-CoA dehydrogenase [Bacteroidota bacterium]
MNILVVGHEWHVTECRQKLGVAHHYLIAAEPTSDSVSTADVIFDFLVEEESLKLYANLKTPVFLNTVFTTLVSIKKKNPNLHSVFGFCGLPTFFNREVLEVSLLSAEQRTDLEKICQLLATDFAVVDDRVGLVTPRIICMIINEAYYTVQEGTASRADIDLAMKLGTNYPFGPFEWCKKIGIENVYQLLNTVYHDTYDERYKICALLKREV